MATRHGAAAGGAAAANESRAHVMRRSCARWASSLTPLSEWEQRREGALFVAAARSSAWGEQSRLDNRHVILGTVCSGSTGQNQSVPLRMAVHHPLAGLASVHGAPLPPACPGIACTLACFVGVDRIFSCLTVSLACTQVCSSGSEGKL